MGNYGMLIDYKYCTGCHACELSCRNEKGLSDSEWGIKVCELGPVKLNGAWMWDYVPVPSDICDCCIDRVEKGALPPCQLHCLGACLEILPMEEILKRMAGSAVSKMACFAP